MWSLAFLLAFFVPSSSCYFYLDRVKINNSTIANANVNFRHDEQGHNIINVTFLTSVAITNMRIYFKFNIQEDQNDKTLKKVLVSSVVDVEKVFKGKQSNVIINRIFAAIKKSMTFEYKRPLPPGTYEFVNFTIGTSFLSFLSVISTLVDLRFVGNIKASNKTNFFAHIAFYGGFRRD